METFVYERTMLSCFKREFHHGGGVVSYSGVVRGENECVLIILGRSVGVAKEFRSNSEFNRKLGI